MKQFTGCTAGDAVTGGVAVAPKTRPAGRPPIRVLPMMLAEPVSVPHLRIVVVATGPARTPTGGDVSGPTARLTRPGHPGGGLLHGSGPTRAAGLVRTGPGPRGAGPAD